jgi:hypothetical protein
MLELEHIAFGNEPIPEVDALDVELVATAVDQARPVRMDEIAWLGAREASVRKQAGQY